LGVALLDSLDRPLPQGGGALVDLARIDFQQLDPRLSQVEIAIASDVQNPALGESGAAAVFAPQKGASPTEVAALEAGLSRWFALIAQTTGRDVRAVPGGGAAGAFAAGLFAFTRAQIQSGVDLLLDYHEFDALVRDAALVITGEGQLDAQTLGGKAPMGIARRAAAFGVPTVALVGGLRGDDAALHDAGIAAVLPIVTRPMPLDEALRDAASLVEQAALRLGYLLAVGARLSRP
jgi:glycerate kinase